MKTIFKTRYDQDVDLFEDRAQALQYAVLILAAAAAPFLLSEYFLGELVLAGDLMSEAMGFLEDTFEITERGKKGKVILATVEGDIHEIGKNIVGMMLSASGFEVIDLGIDVKAEKIVEAVMKTNAKSICCFVS